MSVSRRNFLRSGAAVSAALLFKPGTFIFGQSSSEFSSVPGQSGSYSRAMFEPYVGDTFRIHSGKRVVELKLVAVNEIKTHSTEITKGRTRRTDCFSLQFETSKSLPLSTHTLNHSKLGSFDLFTVQSETRGGILHTAIVNQVG